MRKIIAPISALAVILTACQGLISPLPTLPPTVIVPSPTTPAEPILTPTPTIAPTPTYRATMPPDPNFPTTRDPLKWPFASTSIWNTPIGSNAVYVPATIWPAGAAGMTVDEELIILHPEAPVMDVFYNYESWSGKNRCLKQGELVGQFPIPPNFYYAHTSGTPNASAAILMPDGRTLKQNQPLHHCPGQDYGTTGYIFPDVDLFGDGITGAHGGSGLSAIGGSLRLGELTPGSVIRHALKVNLFCHINCAYDPADATPGYRWPAVQADGYAGDLDSYIRYAGKNPALEMGALLALHPSFNLTDLADNSLGLETYSALILARALQDYGAYLVDDTAWDVYALQVEVGPDGSVSEEFERTWGYQMTPPTTYTPFGRDMQRIFTSLYVVDNNAPETVGGGGNPRQPLAPPITPPPATTPTASVTQVVVSDAPLVRIMPLGDSLTEGGDPGPAASYRGYLEVLLSDAGYNVDFIGSQWKQAHGGSDFDHEGHGGFTIGPDETVLMGWKANLYDHIDYYLTLKPDVILLLIGINDMFPSEDRPVVPSEAPAKLEALVQRIRFLAPETRIMLASLAPTGWSDGSDWPDYMAVCDRAARIANADPKDAIYFVDLHGVLEPLMDKKLDFVDGLHFTESGARKAAQVWFDALVQAGVLNGKNEN